MMARTLIVAAATLLVLSEGLPIREKSFDGERKNPSANPGFDYLHLVQEWPGSFCDGKKGCRWPSVEPTKGWLLHGLWPEYNNGTWPEYCDPNAPFNMTLIQDMLPELEMYWPSLVSSDQASFWAHEWTRHGTCCEHLTPTEHEYFRLVLSLREKTDVNSILASSGIYPDTNTTWSDVKYALEAVLGGQVEVGCNIDARNNKQLFEIRTCYEPAGRSLVQVNCIAEDDASSCGGPKNQIWFPPFQPKPTPRDNALKRMQVLSEQVNAQRRD